MNIHNYVTFTIVVTRYMYEYSQPPNRYLQTHVIWWCIREPFNEELTHNLNICIHYKL